MKKAPRKKEKEKKLRVEAAEAVFQALKEEWKRDPGLLILTGVAVYFLLSRTSERPKWLKDCAPVHSRKAGAWRGKGSYGHGFGANKIHHK